MRVATGALTLPGRGRRARYRVLRTGLGRPSRPVGELILVSRARRARLRADAIPARFPEEFGLAVEHVWRLHQQTARLRVINGVTALMAAPTSLDHIYAQVGQDLARLVQFDALAVLVREAEPGRLVAAHAALPGGATALVDPLSAPPSVARWLRAGHRLDSALDAAAPAAVRKWMLGQGFRSALLVPLTAAGQVLGALAALHRDSQAFADIDAEVMADVARPLASAIQHASLHAETTRRAEENRRRARQNEALLEAGRAVSRSLDLDETIDLILHQAREVLGTDSGGLFTLDEASGELRGVRSLDVEPAHFRQIRIRVGEGITGQAVLQRRMLQSADLMTDPRWIGAGPISTPVPLRQIPGESGLRSMLVAPLVVGDRALGALTVLRRRVHEFTADEQRLVGALADQAAMALEHARLFSSEKRLVDVVLDTLPLGLYVLDRRLSVVRHNPAAGDALGVPAPPRAGLLDMVSADRAPVLEAFVRSALDAGTVEQLETELPAGGTPRTFRLTAAPLRVAEAAETTHVVLLVEDITLQRRLQQQMLLTERLSTAGRLAAGVAHELEQPARHHRGLRRVAAGAERRRRPEGRRGVPGFSRLPGDHRGGGLPLQGDHGKPSPVGARARRGPRARPI